MEYGIAGAEEVRSGWRQGGQSKQLRQTYETFYEDMEMLIHQNQTNKKQTKIKTSEEDVGNKVVDIGLWQKVLLVMWLQQ